MRWKWLPANYSSWIFVRSTDDHRSLQVNPPRPMYGNHRPQEICREIRHRNPSENLSRNLISVPLSREIGEIDWLKRTAISRVLVNWCNPQMFGGVHQVRHFCKRLEEILPFRRFQTFFWKSCWSDWTRGWRCKLVSADKWFGISEFWRNNNLWWLVINI